MPDYTLRIRRYDPQSGEAPHWDEHTVELGERNSVLDAILKVRDESDGSVGRRLRRPTGSLGIRVTPSIPSGSRTWLRTSTASTTARTASTASTRAPRASTR